MDMSSTAQEDADSKDFESLSPGASDNEEDLEGDTIMSATETQVKNGNGKSASNAKDPNRPRRKKARRACFACQRAHLTCGMYLSRRFGSIYMTYHQYLRYQADL